VGQHLPLSAAALALALTTGCTGSKFWAKEPTMAAQGVPTAPLASQARSGGVVQASATSPQASQSSWSASLAKLTGKPERKTQATEMTMLWRNRVDYLPDHTQDGQMSPGLAGQLFLFGPNMFPAPPEGKLIVALYDETPRPPGQPANLPEGWEFDTKTLHNLVMVDERFGKCCALFLPWPNYRADITHIRIAARYEPEHGFPLYAKEVKVTLDHSPPGSGPRVEWSTQTVPAFQPQGNSPTTPGFGGMGGSVPPANFGTLPPAPPGYGSLQPAPSGTMSGAAGARGGVGAMPPAGGGAVNTTGLQPIVTVLRR
jgi:hypothetical protein